MEINLLYVNHGFMGYGRMGTSIARTLREMGVTVYNDLREETHLQGTKLPDSFEGPRETGRSNVVCWLSVPGHGIGWWKGQSPNIFTMWEAQRLPESFHEHLHEYDTVIVPSFHNVELFSHYHRNVRFVPLGVDPVAWHFQPRLEPTKYFRFLCAGSGRRKGTDLAVKAFRALWPTEGSWGSGPIPVLQLKNPRGEDFFGERIEMVAGRITNEEEIELYAGAHCYLGPSRGEGFGLQPLQAIAQGCPTILTDAHGHESYAHLGFGISATSAKSDYFVYGDAGDWWEPNFDELCDRMRFVYDNYAKAVEEAEWASSVALEQFTWENTANGMLDALGRDRLGPYTGPEEWHDVNPLRFRVICRRDGWRDIGGIRYFFERGKEYWQLADVKRVLFEAEELDPACLDDDDPANSGLHEDQLARADVYRAENSVCPTCSQPINAVPINEMPL